jgi:hypothetical protein
MIYYKIKLKENWSDANVRYHGQIIGVLPLSLANKTFVAINHPSLSGAFRFWQRKDNNHGRYGDWTAIPAWIENIVELP